MKKKRTYYLHTIGGAAAHYVPGMQICYISIQTIGRLARSIEQIKAEQKASMKWRRSQGYDGIRTDYGHRRVRLP